MLAAIHLPWPFLRVSFLGDVIGSPIIIIARLSSQASLIWVTKHRGHYLRPLGWDRIAHEMNLRGYEHKSII
jgi:hypothetical protein